MSFQVDIALVISIISFVISAIVGISTYRFNSITIRNDTRLEHNKIMLEIDQMLVNDPDLWSIYDSHPLSKTIEKTPLKKGKKEAFIYYYFNFFDMIYDFYHKQIWKNRNDRKDWESWANFITDFFNGCSIARELFKDSADWYDVSFSKFVMKIITEYEDHEKSKTTSETIQKEDSIGF